VERVREACQGADAGTQPRGGLGRAERPQRRGPCRHSGTPNRTAPPPPPSARPTIAPTAPRRAASTRSGVAGRGQESQEEEQGGRDRADVPPTLPATRAAPLVAPQQPQAPAGRRRWPVPSVPIADLFPSGVFPVSPQPPPLPCRNHPRHAGHGTRAHSTMAPAPREKRVRRGMEEAGGLSVPLPCPGHRAPLDPLLL
jgi:hypothetical protein